MQLDPAASFFPLPRVAKASSFEVPYKPQRQSMSKMSELASFLAPTFWRGGLHMAARLHHRPHHTVPPHPGVPAYYGAVSRMAKERQGLDRAGTYVSVPYRVASWLARS